MRAKRSYIYIFLLLLSFLCLCACGKDPAENEEASEALKNAILAAENGEDLTFLDVDLDFMKDEVDTYGYRLISGESIQLPNDLTGLRECINLINWWCDPASLLAEDVEPAYQYLGVVLINNQVETHLFAFGRMEDGVFHWNREFAVNFDATKLFEMNVNTLAYIELYSAKS